MTITVTSLVSVPDNANPDQSNTSGSFTPTANSRVIVYSFSVTDGGNTYYDPQLSTTITGWTTALTRTARSADISISFNPVFCVWEGVMGASPTAGTVTIDWHTTTDTAYATFQALDLTGTVAIPTHKQAMATVKCEDDGGTSTETHTTNALGSAATTGNTCLVSFGASIDGVAASTTPSGWTAVGTPGSSNYAIIGVWSKTDFTGTTVTCTDLGTLVDNSGSALMEFEEVGGGGPPALMFLAPTQSTTRLL